MTTAASPVRIGMPEASCRVTVIRERDTPSASIVVGEAAMMDVAVSGGPTTNATAVVAVAASPLTVNVRFAIPTAAAEVRVAV